MKNRASYIKSLLNRLEWLENEMDVYTKKCKELATQIEHKRGKEREIQESIEEESKNMEKMANKRAVKLRKVGNLAYHYFLKYTLDTSNLQKF